ncbi:DUF881 domain-containing protein [Cellulomonas shaoxiangyii]|uniref:DUF881 domain-containing protein n=1 Tax=Cellulomonas shaoxiangyii TaxID=2566013 RepID=A0A4P7SHV2_9CELL|nr:DUF881 domain-containing protein [Cellulomonas shaoxiangyii]QCB93590.1 DUF881 domain-containing protein [Cellulomonas shaoxiangyii]TGY85705.1 DUF881 domain-containing protein [Cellulomonas shaoxiangyii]
MTTEGPGMAAAGDGRSAGRPADRGADGGAADRAPEEAPVVDPRDPLGLGDLDAPAEHGSQGAPATADEPRDADPAGETDPGGTADSGGDADPGDGAAVREDDPDMPRAVADDPVDAGPDGNADPDEADPDEVSPVAAGPAAVEQDAPDTAAPPPDTTAALPAAERPAWTRLAHAMRPRTTTGQLLTAALCALLGFALVVQVRQTTDTHLGALRQDDLVRLLDETTTRSDELTREAADLQRERDELLSGSDRQQAALDAARRNAATQGILTGRLPATGPGVEITLTEAEPSIRAGTMLHVLEELRNAGAEAIQLNDQRVTASSAFTGSAGAVVLDGVTLSTPYRWRVIGEPDTIATALEIPGGAIATVRADGGRGTVETMDRVDVTAVRRLPDPVHATPVPDEG